MGIGTDQKCRFKFIINKIHNKGVNNLTLNILKKNAVEQIGEPLLMVAGPGTGKTRVLTEKVVYLVEKGFDANKILVSTFTIKVVEVIK